MLDERLHVTYRVDAGSEQQAHRIANEIAIEQSVEVPPDIVPDGFVRDNILGRVETISQTDGGTYDVVVSYSQASVGDSITQLVNVQMGNICYVPGVVAVDLQIGPVLAKRFRGAQYGISGIRRLLNKSEGPLVASVVKPHGLSADELAQIAYKLAVGGVDILKDDHAHSDQPMAPFEERCAKISAAVARANKDGGRSALYFTNIAGRSESLMAHARFAQEVGAGGIMLLPGLFGFGLTQQLVDDPSMRLPILSHSAMLAPMVAVGTSGFAPDLIFARLQRLAGADISVFTHAGGRLGLSAGACQKISRCCLQEDGHGAPILPCPGGGVGPEHAKTLVEFYGDQVAFLMGGSLLRYRDNIAEGVANFRNALKRAQEDAKALDRHGIEALT